MAVRFRGRGWSLQTSATNAQRELTRKHYGEFPDCPYCGTPFHVTSGVVDHIVPVKMGGTNAKDNIVTVCRDCNKYKASMPPYTFMQKNCYSLNDCRAILRKLGKRTDWLT